MTHTNTNIAAKQLISNNIHNIDTGAPPHYAVLRDAARHRGQLQGSNIYIYIYIYVLLYIYIYIYVCILYAYIYIYICVLLWTANSRLPSLVIPTLNNNNTNNNNINSHHDNPPQ